MLVNKYAGKIDTFEAFEKGIKNNEIIIKGDKVIVLKGNLAERSVSRQISHAKMNFQDLIDRIIDIVLTVFSKEYKDAKTIIALHLYCFKNEKKNKELALFKMSHPNTTVTTIDEAKKVEEEEIKRRAEMKTKRPERKVEKKAQKEMRKQKALEKLSWVDNVFAQEKLLMRIEASQKALEKAQESVKSARQFEQKTNAKTGLLDNLRGINKIENLTHDLSKISLKIAEEEETNAKNRLKALENKKEEKIQNETSKAIKSAEENIKKLKIDLNNKSAEITKELDNNFHYCSIKN